mgnify:CR=1 FL=1
MDTVLNIGLTDASAEGMVRLTNNPRFVYDSYRRLVEMGFAKEEDIAQVLTVQYGFPFLPLANYDISPEVVKVIPLKVAKQYVVIPIDKIGNNLTLAMANPLKCDLCGKPKDASLHRRGAEVAQKIAEN